MVHTEQDYKDAASALPDEYLGSRFGRSGLDKASVSAIHTRALFKDNAEQMGMLGGSVGESVQKRGLALAKTIAQAHAAKTRKEKASTNDVVLLDLLNQHMAPIEEALAEKYGENYYEQIAAKYLDQDVFERLMAIEDPEERKAAMREELAQRFREGKIEIEEPEIRDWLETYLEKKEELGVQIERIHTTGVVKDTDSLRSQFEAKASDRAEQIEKSKVAEASIDKARYTAPDTDIVSDDLSAFLKS